MSEKKVLLISLAFPPTPQVGALRVAKLADYLPRAGWTPIVLTLPQSSYTSIRDPATGTPLKALSYYRRPEKTYEVSAVNPFRFASEMRKNLSRASSSSASALQENPSREIEPAKPHWRFLVGNALRHVLVPDEYAHWVLRATSRGREIIETERPDAIWAFYPHASNLLAGYALSRSSGLPLLLDFRDPWTGFISWGDVPKWRHLIDESLERRILDHARAITVVNDGVADDITRKVPAAKNKIRELPQGIDFAEAAAITRSEPQRQDGVLRIGYGGTLSRNLGDPERFLNALGRILSRGKVDRSCVRVIFVGHSTLDLKSMIEKAGVGDVVETHGHRERYEALGMLSECDQLLLINERPGKVWITGKIWDYLTLRLPILALVDPESAAAKLIGSTGTGRIAPPWDDHAIEAELERTIQEFNAHGLLGFTPNESVLEDYSMSSVARKAADILASS